MNAGCSNNSKTMIFLGVPSSQAAVKDGSSTLSSSGFGQCESLEAVEIDKCRISRR